jgi:hypothetical protein
VCILCREQNGSRWMSGRTIAYSIDYGVYYSTEYRL